MNDVDVNCDVCGNSATVSDCDAVRVEHVLQVWADLHAHDEGQREGYRASMERLHRLHDTADDGTDDE